MRAETLVVCVLDGLADVNLTAAETQVIIGARISGEPVLAVHLFAISHKLGKDIFIALAANFRNRLAAGLHNLKIMVVHPDAPLKIPAAFFNVLGSHVKNISIEIG